MKEVKNAQADFQNNVVPLVSKMDGLNGVADDLLKEAVDKTSIVRDF